jgi:hypothetical protein
MGKLDCFKAKARELAALASLAAAGMKTTLTGSR